MRITVGLGDDPASKAKGDAKAKMQTSGDTDDALAGFLAEVKQMKQKLSVESKPKKKTDWSAHLDSASGQCEAPFGGKLSFWFFCIH